MYPEGFILVHYASHKFITDGFDKLVEVRNSMAVVNFFYRESLDRILIPNTPLLDETRWI